MCKTYYVNPKIGDDENDGLHEDRAFATLFAINRLNLQPGDSVLLIVSLKSSSSKFEAAEQSAAQSPLELMVKAMTR